jgi:hypothetical protein
VRVAELEHQLLQLAAGIERIRVRGQHRFEGRGTGSARVAREELSQIGEVEQSPLLGAVDGEFEARPVETARGEVEQRPRRRRDPETVELGDLVER